MKQLRFLVIAFTLLMGISLTSCLNSDDNSSTDDIYGLFFVRSSLWATYFESGDGVKLYPTTASVAQIEANLGIKISDYKLALIQGRTLEDNKTEKSNTGTKALDFSLTVFSPCEYATALTATDKDQMSQIAPENSPIITMKLNSGYYAWVPSQISEEVIVLPIAWSLQNDKDAFKKHKLALVFVSDEASTSDEMVLYIRHNNGGDTKTDTYATSLYGYDIADAIAEFKVKTGGKAPSKLIIKSHENSQNSTEIPASYTSYSIDYKVAEK